MWENRWLGKQVRYIEVFSTAINRLLTEYGSCFTHSHMQRNKTEVNALLLFWYCYCWYMRSLQVMLLRAKQCGWSGLNWWVHGCPLRFLQRMWFKKKISFWKHIFCVLDVNTYWKKYLVSLTSMEMSHQKIHTQLEKMLFLSWWWPLHHRCSVNLEIRWATSQTLAKGHDCVVFVCVCRYI